MTGFSTRSRSAGARAGAEHDGPDGGQTPLAALKRVWANPSIAGAGVADPWRAFPGRTGIRPSGTRVGRGERLRNAFTPRTGGAARRRTQSGRRFTDDDLDHRRGCRRGGSLAICSTEPRKARERRGISASAPARSSFDERMQLTRGPASATLTSRNLADAMSVAEPFAPARQRAGKRKRRRLVYAARDRPGDAFGREHADFGEIADAGRVNRLTGRRSENDVAVDRRQGRSEGETEAGLRHDRNPLDLSLRELGVGRDHGERGVGRLIAPQAQVSGRPPGFPRRSRDRRIRRRVRKARRGNAAWRRG